MGLKISAEQRVSLLKLARQSIVEFLEQKQTSRSEDQLLDSLTDQKSGVFVTLHKKGRLRGCIGTIEPRLTIPEGVRENACHAAFRDTRFSPLAKDELDEVDIEISLLSLPQKVAYSDSADLAARLTPFVDGVIIEKGHYRATFLPQVWEQLPEPESFLSQLCTKAGLPSGEWKQGTLEVKTYQVRSFGEADASSRLQERS